MVNGSFRIVPKFQDNILDIGIVLSNGESMHIARIFMPKDGQINDNVECGNAICLALKKRIKKSV